MESYTDSFERLRKRFEDMDIVMNVKPTAGAPGCLTVRSTEKGIGFGNIHEDFDIQIMETWMAKVGEPNPDDIIHVVKLR